MAAMNYDFVVASIVVHSTCANTNPASHISKYIWVRLITYCAKKPETQTLNLAKLDHCCGRKRNGS